MARFPLGEHVSDEWYPGVTLPLPGQPQMEEGFALFSPEDEDRFWLLEGHWSRGFTPLCVSAANDVLWGTQFGANLYQLPPTKGQAARMSGVHAYVSDLPCQSEWEVMHRASRVDKLVGPAIAAFPTLWAERLEDIKTALAHFEGADLAAMGLPEVAVYLGEFWAFHRWVWEVHFELMDPLIGNYFAFRATCVELGIDESDVTRFFQGSDTKVMETDRALWALAAAARGTAVEALLAENDPSTALSSLRSSGDPNVDRVAQRTSPRSSTSTDGAPRACATRRSLRGSRTRRPRSCSSPRSSARTTTTTSTPPGRRPSTNETRRSPGFGLSSTAPTSSGSKRASVPVTTPNFAWWQEEHNFYMDMRAHIPLRMAALRIAELVGAEQRDDLIYVFRHELDALARGTLTYADVRDVVGARREYYEAGKARRSEMPRVLGTPNAETDDPIMKEIFGVDRRLLEAVGAADLSTSELTGVPASSGVVRGRARVITSSDDLGEVEPEEILVCVFTTPNWTPAFSQIAGCVCDTGGALSHTAIVSREYRIPAVCGTGLATTVIHTGDILEVDGTAGVVRIIERAG